MKKSKLYLGIFTMLIAFCSCNKNEIRAKMFVEKYNKEISYQFLNEFNQSSPGILTKTYASISPDDKDGNEVIEIVFISGFPFNSGKLKLYKKMFPITFASIVTLDKNAAQFIKSGAKFRVIYTSRNKKSADTLIIDKTKLEALRKEGPNMDLQIAKSDRNNGVDPQIKQLLISYNNGLPILVNEQLQIKLTKIDIDSLNQLVYNVEIGAENIVNLKDEKVKAAMKNEILGNNKIIRLFAQLKRANLSNINYIYKNKSGQRLGEITITEKDILQYYRITN